MGAYIYRTTTTRQITGVIRGNDGETFEAPISVYEYAYKPFWSDETANRRLEKRYIDPARLAFKRLGKKPSSWGITSYEGLITLGDSVFRTRDHIAINDMGFGNHYPYVGTLIAVKYRGPNLRVESMKEDLDAGKDRIVKYMRGSPNGPLDCKFQAIKEGDEYVLRGWINGVKSEDRLWAEVTDNERLLAHWRGFIGS